MILYFYPINTCQKRNSLTPPCCHLPDDCLFVGAGGRERMLETGAVSRQDGAGRGSDGEGLAAASDEEPESQHQLDPGCLSLPLITAQSARCSPASIGAGGRGSAVLRKAKRRFYK